MGNELSSREYRHSPPLVAMTIQNISVTIQQSAKLMLKNYQINQSFPFICVTHQHVMLADNTTQLNSFLTNSPIILQVTVQIITEIITEGTSSPKLHRDPRENTLAITERKIKLYAISLNIYNKHLCREP
jgi:hypothetical protein